MIAPYVSTMYLELIVLIILPSQYNFFSSGKNETNDDGVSTFNDFHGYCIWFIVMNVASGESDVMLVG